MDSTATGEMRLSGAEGPDTAGGDRAPPDPALPAPAPEFLQQVADAVRAWFPRQIEGPELVLIDVDPRVLHAFWSLPLALVQGARATLGAAGAKAPLVLRLTPAEEGTAADREDGPGRDTFDVIVSGLQSRAYIDIEAAARRWRATLGIKCGDGTLIALAHSNTAALPPVGPAPLQTPAVEVEAQPPPVAAHAEPAAFTPGPAAAAPIAPAAEATPAPEAVLATDVTASAGGKPAAAPEANPIIDAPAGEPFALEEVLPLSSFVLGRGGHDVALEVTAELYIHGRTEPGRTLKLFGKDIRVRPDGTFALRRILPNDPTLLSALLASEDADDLEGGR